MCRYFICLAALFSMLTVSVPVLAENAAAPVVMKAQKHRHAPVATHAGFYIHLPEVDHGELVGLIKTYQAALSQRKEQIAQYLHRNRLAAKDALITALMPGGLIYAVVRKGRLEEARAELAQISVDMHEISRDLLVVQAEAGELTLAQLQ